MMNDQRPESTCLISIHPPPATVLAIVEDLLKDPASVHRGSPRNISLSRSEFVYVIMVILEECNRLHQVVHDGLVKNNKTAEARIRTEARKYRELMLELNTLKSELKHIRESAVEPKDIDTNVSCVVSSLFSSCAVPVY
jgi:hypothetical protein